MKHRLYGTAALLALIFLMAPLAARADIITPIFSDNFEGDTGDVLNATLKKWTVVSGSVDVLTAGNVCGPAAGNYSKCVDLDGTGTKAGTIQTKTTFTLDEGTYQLKFDLAGANRPWELSKVNTVVVSLGGFFTEAFTLGQYDPFQTFTREIVVSNTGSAKINFAHSGADWMGLLLDNVYLARITYEEVVPTPESGAWELILIAAIGVGVWGFRRNTSLAARV